MEQTFLFFFQISKFIFFLKNFYLLFRMLKWSNFEFEKNTSLLLLEISYQKKVFVLFLLSPIFPWKKIEKKMVDFQNHVMSKTQRKFFYKFIEEAFKLYFLPILIRFSIIFFFFGSSKEMTSRTFFY